MSDITIVTVKIFQNNSFEVETYELIQNNLRLNKFNNFLSLYRQTQCMSDKIIAFILFPLF